MKRFTVPEPYKNREEWEEAIRKDERSKRASKAVKARWDKTTKEERIEHAKRLAEKRWRKLSTD